jgi:hypothetical protein
MLAEGVSPRMRRECRGELIQVDGSYHRWFEKRGPEACLIAFIDDATSEIMHLRMVDHESSFNYMRCLKWYIEQYGRPLALYSDKHSIFRATNTDASGNRNATQFSRACNSLGIKVICASSPQAKGRVERSFRTHQDRLIKEMRLVFKDLTVSFNKIRFILEDSVVSRRCIGKRVTVVVYLEGRIEIYDDEISLPYRTFDKLTQAYESEVVDRKRLGSAMQTAQAVTAVEPHHFRRNNHIMAGFRDFFPQPTDPVSLALQHAPKK